VDLISLRTCTVDRIGIPDLSDLRRICFDLDETIGVSFHITTDSADPDHPLHYPFAALEDLTGLHYIPLEPSPALEVAEDCLALLREVLAPKHI
jgi:hypothetical protein